MPQPGFPGQTKFKGAQFHAHRYIDPLKPLDLIDKTVVAVGMGNSAMDIASEISRPGIAKSPDGLSEANDIGRE